MGLFKVFQSALFCYPPTIKECGKLYLCICVFVCVYLDVRHLGTLFLRSSYHLLFKNVSHHGSFQSVSKCLILLPTNHKRVWQTVFVYLCICVFVCVYLDVRHLGKLFLRSSYHLLFKNISHHGSFQGVSKCLILLPTNHKRGIKKEPEPREGATFERIFFWILLLLCKPPSKSAGSHLYLTKSVS